MDKKNLVFIFLLTMALFGVNQYFSSKASKIEKPVAQTTEAKPRQSQGDLSSRIAPLSSFPLIELYKDEQGAEFLALALHFGSSYLTTTNETEFPKLAYVKKGKQFTPIDLFYHHDNGFVFYTSSGDSALTTTYLPQVGVHDLQVISFFGTHPEITLGQLKNGSIFFPVSSMNNNAIGLYQSDRGYIPIGYYDAKENDFIYLSEFKELEPVLTFRPFIAPEPKEFTETFYVLQNETQQIVFSSRGGSIAEINLPFQTKTNQESVIKEINFDHVIEKDYTQNSMFPLNPYLIADAQGKQERRNPQKGGYYPLLRRDLIAKNGSETSNIAPRFYAMSLINEEESYADIPFSVSRFTGDMIEFVSTQKNRRITKTYTLPKTNEKAPYCLNVSIKVDGDARGLWLNSGLPEVELISRAFSPVLKYRMMKNGKGSIEKISLPKETTTLSNIEPYWIANTNGFFGLILEPLSEINMGLKASKIPGNLVPTRLSLIDAQYDLYPASKYPGYEILVPFKNTSGKVDFRLYAGPLEDTILKQVDTTYLSATGVNPDFSGAQSFHGFFSFISEPFSRFLFLIMKMFYSFTHSWGFSIILLTIVLRILMYPLNAWSFKSTARMQLIAPKTAKLQEKYKKDPKRLQMEMLKLYKDYKVNPFSGCLPILIQMPFLIGMFDLLKSTFGLRGATFIPGWINNLAAPDVLFSWSYPIFFIGTSFHLLPIILGATMFLQQKMMSKGKVEEMTDQQRQQQTMGTIMTLGFTFLFYHFPSGLNIYWISSSLLGILQQWFTNRRVKAKGLSLKKT